MSTGRRLYRALSRVIRTFDNERLPLHGATGQQAWISPTEDNIAYLQTIFRQAPSLTAGHIDETSRVLRQLQARLGILRGADSSARTAMAMWWQLGKDAPRRQHGGLEGVAMTLRAFEMAALAEQDDSGTTSETAEEDGSSSPSRMRTADALHQLRQEVSEEVTAANAVNGPAEGRSNDADQAVALRIKQLQLISEVLFQKHKFRQAPFEWVYDGLSPVLLPDVLQTHKGLCIVLSMVYIMVAAPLNIDLVMMRVPQAPSDASLAGSLISRTAVSATAPPTVDWMVYAPGPRMLRVDPLNKGSVTEVTPTDPAYQVLQARPAYYLTVWAELARIMMIAHQRRGESDDVAHWTWQVLALDHAAPEWHIFESQ